jgi:putative tryptophan/tyrosine transport system substrate-binding protein
MTVTIGRRELLAALGGAAAWPLAARAQQPGRMRHIAILMLTADDADGQARITALREGLEKLGWTEGRNLRIDTRWAAGDTDRMRTYVTELLQANPDAILANGSPAVAALRQETRSIPIVFAAVIDPLGQSFVSNLARPGSNITGFTNMEFTVLGKMLELLKGMAPSITRAAALFNPATVSMSPTICVCSRLLHHRLGSSWRRHRSTMCRRSKIPSPCLGTNRAAA